MPEYCSSKNRLHRHVCYEEDEAKLLANHRSTLDPRWSYWRCYLCQHWHVGRLSEQQIKNRAERDRISRPCKTEQQKLLTK